MHYWPGLPSLVFGGTSLLAGMATFFVPDTADTSLPDTVRQAELLGSSYQEKEIEKENNVIMTPFEKTCSKL